MELTDKLKLKQDVPLLLVDAPGHLAGLFVAYAPQTEKDNVAQAVWFVTQAHELAAGIRKLAGRLKEDALLWICYPKKSSNIQTDLGRDSGWDQIVQLGYEPVTSVAVDKDWTGLRLKKKEAIGGYIRGVPMEERAVEGIDFKNRTAILPADAQQAVNEHTGMAAFFDKLAFTHKKEYVMAIVTAKKPETRAGRIEKMIDMLHQKMAAKQQK